VDWDIYNIFRIILIKFFKWFYSPDIESDKLGLGYQLIKNGVYAPLGLRGAQKIVEALPKSGLVNKHARLYILRHSRATHLAKHLIEAQMSTFFGWVQGTQVVRRYIHLSGKDLDSTLLALSHEGSLKAEEYEFKSLRCIRCSEDIVPGSNFCGKCSLPLNSSNKYTREMDLENENKNLKLEVESVRQEMNKRFSKIMSMIQQNAQLAYIKPEALTQKTIEQLKSEGP
jgi:integrase/recombinase XerD